MNIGIITWFSYKNYGTKLQAIALQEYLKKDNAVHIINFQPPAEKSNLLKRILGKIERIKLNITSIAYRKQIDDKNVKLNNTIEKYCTLTNPISGKSSYIDMCNKFDVIICGSDQIWNPNRYHPYYYADYDEIKVKRIAYAPSLGISNIPNEKREVLSRAINKFDSLGIREKKGVDLLKSLTNKKIEQVLDPTFLLSKKEWSKLLNISEKANNDQYVLCYFLGHNSNHWMAVREFTKVNHLELRIIPISYKAYVERGIIEAAAGVEDFVELIANAKYILTDSFHGAVFSIIFNKQFFVFERFDSSNSESQNSRIYDLLRSFDLKSRLILYNSKTIIKECDIDYIDKQIIVNKSILKSKEYLEKALFN